MAGVGAVWARFGVAAIAIAGGGALVVTCGRMNEDHPREGTAENKSRDGRNKPPQPDDGTPSAACPPLAVTADLQGVFAVAASDVWVVGNAGTVLHFDGCWRVEPRVTDADLFGVWASADGTVWAGGAAGTTLRRSGGAWAVFTTPGTQAVRGVWATATDTWAAAEDAIFRWDGAAWQLSQQKLTLGTYNGIWGAASDDVWIVGSGNEPDGDRAAVHEHWDGTAWTTSFSCNPDGNRYASGGWIATPRDVWGTGADAVWAGGQCNPGASFIPEAFVERFGGGAWQELTIPAELADFHPTKTVWASSVTDVWAASAEELIDGHVPTMLHFDGTTWTASADPATAGVLDIGGTGAGDVWAVGPAGKRLHFDGSAWVPSP